jgi:hypothetical protein
LHARNSINFEGIAFDEGAEIKNWPTFAQELVFNQRDHKVKKFLKLNHTTKFTLEKELKRKIEK